MSLLDDAKAAADAAQKLVADLEAEASATDGGTTDTGTPQEFSAQCISNADGTVIITLTPEVAEAPAASVSDTTVGNAGETTEPAGSVTTDEGPTATGQG